MRKQTVICGVISTAMFGTFSQAQITTWTNQAGNNLWSDPTNWNNGVPMATSEALISLPGAQIDLGGATWPVGNLRLSGVGVSAIGNGTFVLNELAASNSASATIQAAIRPAGPELRIATQPTFQITGNIDAGGSDVRIRSGAIVGDLSTTGTIRFWQGFTRLLNGNETEAAQIDVRRGTLAVEAGAVISPTTPIHVADGAMVFTAPSKTFRLGVMELGAGTSVFSAASAAPAMAVVSAASLNRHDLATLVLSRTANAALRLRFDTPLANTGGGTLAMQTGVVPWAVARGTAGNGDYAIATYDLGPDTNDPSDDFGLRGLDPTLEHRPDIVGATPMDNVRLASSATLASPITIQTLTMFALNAGANVLTLNAPLAINGGVLLGTTTSEPILRPNEISGTGSISFSTDAYIGSIADATVHRLDVLVPVFADRIIARGTARLSEARSAQIIVQGALTLDTAFANEIIIQSGGVTITNGGSSSIRVGPNGGRVNISGPSYSSPIHFEPGQDGIPASHGLSGQQQTVVTSTLSGGGNITINRLRHDGNANWNSASFLSVGVVQLNGVWRSLSGDITLNQTRPGTLPIIGELQGNGSFLGDVIGGIIDPGAPIGRLTIEAFSAGGTPSELRFMLTGAEAGAEYDQLRVLEAISLDENLATLRVQTDFWTTPAFGDSFTLIDNLGSAPILGHFIGLPEGGTFLYGALKYQVSYVGGDGNNLTVTVVPEPALSLSCLAALFAFRRRRLR